MKRHWLDQTIIGRCFIVKKQGNNKNPHDQQNEKKIGYGDKKLEGPNRPST